MKLSVIGAGYVGLVTAAGLARLGHEVRLGEADAARLALLENGQVPIFEDGLAELLDEARAVAAVELPWFERGGRLGSPQWSSCACRPRRVLGAGPT